MFLLVQIIGVSKFQILAPFLFQRFSVQVRLPFFLNVEGFLVDACQARFNRNCLELNKSAMSLIECLLRCSCIFSVYPEKFASVTHKAASGTDKVTSVPDKVAFVMNKVASATDKVAAVMDNVASVKQYRKHIKESFSCTYIFLRGILRVLKGI